MRGPCEKPERTDCPPEAKGRELAHGGLRARWPVPEGTHRCRRRRRSCSGRAEETNHRIPRTTRLGHLHTPRSPGPAERRQDKAQRPRCPASSLQLADAAARGLFSPTQGPVRTGAHGGARGFDQLLQLIGRLRAEKPAKATASKFASKNLRCVMINFLTTVASITLFSKSSAANTVNTHTPREIIRSTPGQKRKG